MPRAASELPAVSGDYAAAGITNISFDVYYETGQTYLAAAFRVRFQDPTFNGWYYPLANDFAQGWHSYSIPLDPTMSDADAVLAGWIQEDPTISFAQTFSNVSRSAPGSGNSTRDTVSVTVPHDKSGHAQAAAGFAPAGNDFRPNATEYTLVIPSKGNFDARTVLLERAFVGNEQGYVRPLTATLVDFDHDRDIDAVLTFDVAATHEIAGQSANAAQVSEISSVNMRGYEGEVIMAAPGSGKPTPLSLLYETTSGETYLTGSVFKLPRAEKPATSDPDDGVHMELGTTSTAQFALSHGGHTTVEIFNVLGQKLRTLVDQDLDAGSYRMPWDGRDDSGRKISSGMYFVRIVAPGVQRSTRIVLAR